MIVKGHETLGTFAHVAVDPDVNTPTYLSSARPFMVVKSYMVDEKTCTEISPIVWNILPWI
jgi:hypothetical protein